MGFYLYVIKSGDRSYVGVTKDLNKRLDLHNKGRNKSTKHLKNWKISFFRQYRSLGEARIEELNIKRGRAKNLHLRGVAQSG